MKVTPKSLFGLFAFAEMITWALLISAIIARAVVGVPQEIFFAVGAAHGFAFLGFAAVSKLVGLNQRWSYGRIALTAALAIVPFATLPFERRLLRKGDLEGAWRSSKSDDPRDNGYVDSIFRWFVRHPYVLIAALFTSLIAVFAFLLWLGPPYEWGSQT